MAVRNMLVAVPPARVWEVLADGWSYADWVVGTRKVRAVDDGWPAVGTSLHFSVGVPPVGLDDVTTVRICVPHERLELEANARPWGSARIAIRLLGWGEGCLVVVDEHPLRGPAVTTHSALTEVLLQWRHRRMLANLARLTEASPDR